jgi:hypothetical protein
MEEKEAFLQEAFEESYVLFFQHDLYHECCTLNQTEKGIRPEKTFPFRDLAMSETLKGLKEDQHFRR